MIYQLPNGKTVYLTLEEFLDLDDFDIQFLMSVNAGEHINNPFHGSAIKKHQEIEDEDQEEDDASLDYTPEINDISLNDDCFNSEDDHDGLNFTDINSIL